jgi:hypothetical protein
MQQDQYPETYAPMMQQQQQQQQQVYPPQQQQQYAGHTMSDTSIFRNLSNPSRSSQDPPSSLSEVPEFDDFRHKGAVFDKNQVVSQDDTTMSRRRRSAYDQQQTKASNSKTATSNGYGHLGATSIYAPSHNERGGKNEDTTSFAEISHELKLTQTIGGKLGAAEFPTTPSDTASSFFDKILSGGKSEKKRQDARAAHEATLGARALGEEEQRRLAEKSSYEAVLRRAGLYDVFAPSGPIGIVVDTTRDGPAVHSLKSSSPMLGLINPGDLIVGLDDEDTRSMTAATLTRLMARKGNQKERKITLLAADTY